MVQSGAIGSLSQMKASEDALNLILEYTLATLFRLTAIFLVPSLRDRATAVWSAFSQSPTGTLS